MNERLAEGYQPNFDLDAAAGRQGEVFVRDVALALATGSVEVKTDEKAFYTGNIYIEVSCCTRRGWEPSGIATTAAEVTAYVLRGPAGEVLVAGPTHTFRLLAQRGRPAATDRGSHPTQGVLVPLSVLLSWAMEVT